MATTSARRASSPTSSACRCGRPPATAMTHAHGAHVGSARKPADELGGRVGAPAGDREATESGKAVVKPALRRPGLSAIAGALGNFPGVPVTRELQEGDELGAGFV